MRIIFMGSPHYALQTLDALLQSKHDVVAIYTQPPKRSGRGKPLTPNPVHARAIISGVPVYTPESLRDKDVIETFRAHDADLAVVIAYGLILPNEILEAPKWGAVNLHASLLPRWRGAAPIQRAIMAGDIETGVDLMKMEAGLDTGPVFSRAKIQIKPEDTATSLQSDLARLSAKILMENLDRLPQMTPTPQAQEGICYAHKIEKTEARINWDRPALEVLRHIHGLSAAPGAWFQYADTRIKIIRAEIIKTPHNEEPGTLLDGMLTIGCQEGAIRPIDLQRAGRGIAGLDDFLRGFTCVPGTFVGDKS